VSHYQRKNAPKATGRPSLNHRVAIGAVIIKHLCALDDRETVAQITENMYMQYFLSYSSYSKEPPFDPSLFVEIRKRMSDDLIAKMNDSILEYSQVKSEVVKKEGEKVDFPKKDNDADNNKGELLMDASVCPQDIAYPTDLNLLNEARAISEKIIDMLHRLEPWPKKPRTYRKVARKKYLHIAQNRNPSKRKIRRGIKEQIQYLRRNLSMVNGYSSMDTNSWEAFNESTHLIEYVENFKSRFGHYPAKVLVDKIYVTRINRKWLKDRGIKLAAKPMGRPSAKAVADHVSPGERNPIKGKFEQAKNGYGMNLIRARLKITSQSWIASIILVLNLVKLTGIALHCLSFFSMANPILYRETQNTINK
jgi:hypothetical protein